MIDTMTVLAAATACPFCSSNWCSVQLVRPIAIGAARHSIGSGKCACAR
jgi:hypothetical protein